MMKAEVIYRVVQDEKDDLDMTRAEAIRIYQQLRLLLWPRSRVTTKRRRGKRKTG